MSRFDLGLSWSAAALRPVLLALLLLAAGAERTEAQRSPPRPSAEPTAGAAGGWERLEAVAALARAVEPRDGEWARAALGEGAGCALPSPAESEAMALEAEATARASDPALSMEASYRGAPDGTGLGEGWGGSYVGLSWELLGDGFFENRERAEQLRTRARLERLRARTDSLARGNRCRILAAEQRLAGLEMSLLRARATLLEEMAAARRRGYFEGGSVLDDLLEADRELRLARERIALHPLTADTTAPQRFPPLLDLDFDALARRVEGDSTARAELALGTRLVQHDARDDGDLRLRLFLRYQPQDAESEREGFYAGLRFQRALAGARADAGLEHRMERERREWRARAHARLAGLEAVRRDYQARRARVVREHYRYLSAYERLRRSLAEHRVYPESASRADAAERGSELLDAALARADALARAHAAIGEAFLAAAQPYDPELLAPVPLPGIGERGRPGERALYVWSAAFNRHPNRFLLELARAQGITRLVVSAGAVTDSAKLADLVRLAGPEAIRVERMLSTNTWALPEQHARARERVAALPKSSGGIHLDVEPHTLPGFEADRDRYLADYLDLIAGVRAELDASVPLALSVPVWWPPEVYRQLGSHADRVYLMAYGHADPGVIWRRLQPALAAIGHDRVVVALRPSDFGSEWAMEEAVAALAAFGVERFAFHDLDSLLALVSAVP